MAVTSWALHRSLWCYRPASARPASGMSSTLLARCCGRLEHRRWQRRLRRRGWRRHSFPWLQHLSSCQCRYYCRLLRADRSSDVSLILEHWPVHRAKWPTGCSAAGCSIRTCQSATVAWITRGTTAICNPRQTRSTPPETATGACRASSVCLDTTPP